MSTVLGGFNVQTPTDIITGETRLTSDGQLGIGSYMYAFTYQSNYGETLVSPPSAFITSVGSIFLTNIPASTNKEVLTKCIYRTAVNGSTFKLLTTVLNSIITYLDILPDSVLGNNVPIANWASSAQVCEGWTEFSKPIVYSVGDITAAGSTASTATLLEVENAFVTVPTNLNGIILPVIKPNLVGQKFIINNTSATNNLRVYPALPSESIAGGGSGVPYVLGPQLAMSVVSSGALQWSSLNTGLTLPPSLVSLGNLATSGNEIPYTIATNTWALSPITAAGRSFLTEGSPAAQRAAIGAVIGLDVQAYSANLAALDTIGNLPANNMIYTTGSGYANSVISPYARTCLSQTTAAGFRSAIGLAYLPPDNNGGINLSADIVVGQAAVQTLTGKTIDATSANTLVLGAGTSFNGLAFQTVVTPNDGDVLGVVGGKLALVTPVVAGDVVGPASATDNAVALFSGTTGKLLKESPVTITGSTVDGVGVLNATTVNTNSLAAVSVTGTLQTAAQPNVTSVGTLSSLGVSGVVNAGGLATFNGSALVPTGKILTIVDQPTTGLSAANKAYVDLVASTGAAPLVPAAGATTGVLPNTPTYSSTGTLTATGGILILTIDTITYVVGDGQRLLVKNQADPRQNGMYTRVANSGGNWQLARTTDFDTPAEATQGTSVLVLGGAVNINTSWSLQQSVTQFNPSLATPGSSDVIWIQISASQNLTAGAGLSQTGNAFNVGGTTNRIDVGADNVDISATYVGQTSITTLGTISAGTWNATTIGAPRGGTGLASPTAGNVLITNGATAMTLKANPASAFVGISDVQTVTNKIVSSGRINTAGVVFANTDVTAATLTLNTALLTAARSVIVPDSSDTMAVLATAQTFTNKTMISNTNNVLARGLWTASGANAVSTYTATSPTSGQVLTATSATTAIWQTPSGGGTGFAPARTLFVYQGASGAAPNFATFGAALAYAITITPTIANQVLICVYPGVYSEVNPITVPAFITITSMTSSQSGVLLRPATPAISAPMLITNGNARLMGFIVSGRDAAGGYATIGIKSSGSAGAIDLFTFMTVRNCSQSCYQAMGNGTIRSHLVVTSGCTAQNTIVGTSVPVGFECGAGASLGGVNTIITGIFTSGVTGEITNGLYVYNDMSIADINVLHVTYCTNALRVGGGTESNSQTQYPVLRLSSCFIANISGVALIMDEKSTCVASSLTVDDSSGFFPNQLHLVVYNPALPAEPNLIMMVGVVSRSDKVVFSGAMNNPPRMIGYGISDIPGGSENRFQGGVTVGSVIAPAEFSAGEGESNIIGMIAMLESRDEFTNVTTALSAPSRDPIAVDLATVGVINLNSAPDTIDGATPVSGITRVLVMYGSTNIPEPVSRDNGIYIWNGTGVAMTRAEDFAAGSNRSHNTWFSVDSGDVNYGTVWKISEFTLNGTDTINVNKTSWGVRAQSCRVFSSLEVNGDNMYIGNVAAKFPGVLLSVVKPIIMRHGGLTPTALVWEFWDGRDWVVLRFMAALADDPHSNCADSSFANGLTTINPEVIRVNYRFSEFDSWATTQVNKILAYWVRVRCIDVSLITLIPTITRLRLHCNYTLIGHDGFNEYFGTARPRVDTPMTWASTGERGEDPGIQRIIFCSSPVVISRDGIMNLFNTGVLQSVVMIWNPPTNVDSSSNLIVKVDGSVSKEPRGNIVLVCNYVFVKRGDAVPDVSGSPSAIGKPTVVQIFEAPTVDYAEFSTTMSLDITGLDPDTDMLVLKFSRDGTSPDDTCRCDMFLHTIVLSTLQWAVGDYNV